MSAREYLDSLYRDWFNNWLSVSAFAQHHGLTDEVAEILIELARTVATTKHPEA